MNSGGRLVGRFVHPRANRFGLTKKVTPNHSINKPHFAKPPAQPNTKNNKMPAKPSKPKTSESTAAAKNVVVLDFCYEDSSAEDSGEDESGIPTLEDVPVQVQVQVQEENQTPTALPAESDEKELTVEMSDGEENTAEATLSAEDSGSEEESEEEEEDIAEDIAEDANNAVESDASSEEEEEEEVNDEEPSTAQFQLKLATGNGNGDGRPLPIRDPRALRGTPGGSEDAEKADPYARVIQEEEQNADSLLQLLSVMQSDPLSSSFDDDDRTMVLANLNETKQRIESLRSRRSKSSSILHHIQEMESKLEEREAVLAKAEQLLDLSSRYEEMGAYFVKKQSILRGMVDKMKDQISR